MLYYLFQWLDKYDFPGAGMFGYTSFRALMAIILALLISSIWGDKFIDLLKRCVVRFIRICRRLHQDIQERQGRPAR
jgi:hypothetical protein